MNRLSTRDPIALFALLGVIALTAVGVTRITLSHAETSQTIDEAVHIAAGVEWLDQHSYRLHPENPPLARVAVGLLPYWDGARPVTGYDQANAVLGSGGDYRRRLTLGRVGTLPAFVLLATIVYGWSKSVFGPATALASVFLLTTLPVVLAHSGLATTDVAAAAATLSAVLAFAYWLQEPSHSRAAFLGVATGVAALVKFTALLFLSASALAIVVTQLLLASPPKESGGAWAWVRIASQFYVSAAVATAIVWSGYGWSAGPVALADPGIDPALAAAWPEAGLMRGFARALLAAWLPAPEFFFGLVQAALHGLEGHSAYLLGEIRRSGWWYFFPVAIAVKTPLVFLALALAGGVRLVQRAVTQRQWLYLVPVVAPAAMLISVMPSSLNIGLRHVLAIFPFLSICAGVAIVCLFRAKRHPTLARVVAGALLAWQLTVSLAAHRDTLAYFNPIASGHPEDFLIDSDLDWGQDLYRLRDALLSRGIEDASLALFTTADLGNLGLDGFGSLQPGERKRGWVAASIFTIRRQPGYAWLEGYEPEALVGRSIRLYHIDPEARRGSPGARAAPRRP